MYRRLNNAVLMSSDYRYRADVETMMKRRPGWFVSCMCCAMRNAQPCTQPILEPIS